ncbi:alginate export family protein [Gilvimarinus sp. SDUM040013]|uniref:Alginate export family protein n=1 Tax=Gilvimarinus gilvus TaxID=3058038 RepID=A0ABU4S3R6_9GAMM|nr:alginate export family protein [Gilvimarinus sp. SDUM040013]MDO3388780.1 alginate export family protein [Gilvimarinus sp. SDUM040013]MDX6850533.1 alginate export family protein [Gilvimarinus sp. SDUM040013]
MKKQLVLALGAAGLVGAVSAQAQEAASIKDALVDGDIKLNLRLRYEDVSWDGLEDSDALTLRTRLSFTSQEYKGFGLTLEMDDVKEVGDVDYRTAPNDPNNPGTAVIPDPEGTEVNQAYLSYSGLGKTTFKYGRQRILLDNQRFVGGVGWRQNEQTYDAFSVTNKAIEDGTFFYAYVTNVNRIFGEQNPIGDHKHESHLVNFNYAGWGAGKLSAYAYLLDNQTAAALSSDTMGARWVGKAGDMFSYTLEYATQTEAGDNPTSYDADYMLGEAAFKFGGVSLTGGYELLGSDDGVAAFSTPLATLHKFQGWTDRFLSTPAAGVEDIYVGASGAFGGVKLSATYHELASDYGSTDYGQELDVSAAKKFGPVLVLVKYADYQADDYGSDTQKFWLMLNATF